MPTPFMHLALAERLIDDPMLPSGIRQLMRAEWGAFLLGSIAPDARRSGGQTRASTHFFEYGPVISPPALTAMLQRYPALRRAAISEDARAAFVAGYAAHLAMDEVWCVRMLFPYFVWEDGTPQLEMRLFHILLAILDRRDRTHIPASQYTALRLVAPQGWLPFMSDADLIAWRDLVAGQLAPGGESQSLRILGRSVGLTAETLAALMDDRAHRDMLNARVSAEVIATVETAMYDAVRMALIAYTGYTGDAVEAPTRAAPVD